MSAHRETLRSPVSPKWRTEELTGWPAEIGLSHWKLGISGHWLKIWCKLLMHCIVGFLAERRVHVRAVILFYFFSPTRINTNWDKLGMCLEHFEKQLESLLLLLCVNNMSANSCENARLALLAALTNQKSWGYMKFWTLGVFCLRSRLEHCCRFVAVC